MGQFEDWKLFDNFFEQDYFNDLLKNLAWRQDQITIFGKTHPLPRLQCFYGDEGLSYSYSKMVLPACKWSPQLLEIKEKIEAATNESFNSVLCNYYREGSDHNSWHADDEKELGEGPVIASASFGGERFFELRKKGDHQLKRRFTLGHKSLFLMGGTVQNQWQHRLVKTAKNVQPRINLTYRKIIN